MPDVPENDGLTVGDVSARLGVTVRTLHHWDEVGLAQPSLRSAAGYRLYTSEDLQQLHRITVYCETGLGLEKIRSVLDDSSTDIPTALRALQAAIDQRTRRLKQSSSE